MPDYKCNGCGELIEGGYVIVGKSDTIPGSDTVRLHAGELIEGDLEEVTAQISNLDSCFAKYMHKDPRNDICSPKVVHFNLLEKEADKI